MNNTSSNITLYLQYWRELGGHEAEISEADLSAWTGLLSRFSKRSYKSANGSLITVEVDWSAPVEVATQKSVAYSGRVEDMLAYISKLREQFSSDMPCPAKIYREDGSYVDDSDYLIYYLYECYILMNLASPGSFSLFNSKLKRDSSEKRFIDREISSSPYVFEDALLNYLTHQWPPISILPFEDVLSWYLSLELNLNQIAESRIERAMFSLLHVSNPEIRNPEALMWFAYSLEALFDTPNALSYNFLVRRVTSLLNVPENKQKLLGKKIREFYNQRNSFAHGKSKILHPLEHEGWDKEVDEYRFKLYDACDFAGCIVIASLQKYIQLGIREVNYIEQEHLVGI